MFKIFPGTFTNDNRKVPIKEMIDWKTKATSDQATIAEWSQLYSHKIQVWMVPTGASNGILVLDVDVKDNGYETLKNYYLPQTLSQTTKSGGKHFFYRYPTDGKNYGNRTRFDAGLDIRGEGGYVAFYGTDNTPIAEAPSWLLEQSLNVEKNTVDLNNLVYVSPEIVQSVLLDACENIRIAPEGESNNVLNIEAYRIGQFIPSGSINREAAYEALFKAAKERGKPDYEAKATINSGLSGGAKQPFTSPFGNTQPEVNFQIPDAQINDRWTPPFFTRHDLTNLSKLRKPQIFKDWSTEDIHITTADGGTGKTTLKLNEAISLALGEPFLGFDCIAEGRTLFITGEDSREKIGALIGAIMKQRGILDDPEKCRKVMNNIIVKKDTDLCLISKTKDGFINVSQDAVTKVLQAIEDFHPRMVVFDPISSFWGSENMLNDMSKAVTKFMGIIVERSNACVEAINHMGKQSSSSKDMSQFAGRGGTGLPSHARVSRSLRPVLDEEFYDLAGYELPDDQSAILCNVNKFSDGSPLYNKPFLIVRDGYLFSRIALVESKVKEVQDKMSDTDRIFNFIKEERSMGRFPNISAIIAHFSMSGEKISKDRTKIATDYLMYAGHLGEKIKHIENPDIEVGGKVFVITDLEGKEI